MHAVDARPRRAAGFWLRVALAFAVAPLAPVIAYFFIMMVIEASSGSFPDSISEFRGVFEFLGEAITYGANIAYPAALALGAPFFAWSLATKHTSLSWYHFAGTVIGVITTLWLRLFDDPYRLVLGEINDPKLNWLLVLLPFGALLGAFTGYCFWKIARPDRYVARPDRQSG